MITWAAGLAMLVYWPLSFIPTFYYEEVSCYTEPFFFLSFFFFCIAFLLPSHLISQVVPKMFPSYVPHCRYLFPTRGTKPQGHPDTMALPSCSWASVYPQMPRRCYNTGQLSVCQINGKTYWTGTIMQTNEITDQLCP